jgi:hypothetical protein
MIKGIIELNDQVQVFNGILSGQYMRIVPVPNDNNYTWHSWLDNKFEPDEASQKVMGPYFASVLDATKNGDFRVLQIKNWLSYRTISTSGDLRLCLPIQR